MQAPICTYKYLFMYIFIRNVYVFNITGSGNCKQNNHTHTFIATKVAAIIRYCWLPKATFLCVFIFAHNQKYFYSNQKFSECITRSGSKWECVSVCFEEYIGVFVGVAVKPKLIEISKNV